ncbi:MAG: sulfatase-like hydrolase/transferase [Phycisphaerae bacterium]|nr:sulfatase-like hydrolase/transferase [Phycisphaerae bacterium]
MQRIPLLILAWCGLFTVSAMAAPAGDTPPGRPNIILVFLDDMGWGDLGCYGQKMIQTPCLDRMASEGVRFTSAYAGTSVCAPTRCSLMTGLHVGHTVVRANQEITPEGQMPMPKDTVTVARLLQQAGYRTACIGKWGLGFPGSGSEPMDMGFDYFFGYNCQRHAHNYYTTYLWRNDEHVLLPGNANGQRGQYSHDVLMEDAFAWLRKQGSQPFFLYLPLTIPHGPRTVPDWGPYKDKPWPDTEKDLAGMITRLDADMGRLFDLLKELKLDERTIVLFTSDNGPAEDNGEHRTEFFDSNGPWRGAKRGMYEGSLRVPAIARWPGRIQPDTVSDQPWAFWDFLPTALELADAKVPADLKIDGISFVPALFGRPMPQRPYFYWELHEGPVGQAVRFGDWKAVRNGIDKPVELYNLQTDPGEQHDVAAKHPEELTKAEKLLKTARTDSPDWPMTTTPRRRKPIREAKYTAHIKHWLVRDGDPAACVVVGTSPDPVTQRAADILNRDLQERVGTMLPVVEAPTASSPELAIYLTRIDEPVPFGVDVPDAVRAARQQGQDGIVLRTVLVEGKRYVYVGGTNPRSTIYAVGTLLRNLTFAGRDVTLPMMGMADAADSSLRGFWFANHGPDVGYEKMSMPQFRTYLEDVTLWGVNTVGYAPIDFHNWKAEVFVDPAAFEQHMKRNVVDVPDVIDDYDLRIGVKMFVNNVFSDDTAGLHLKPNVEGSDSSLSGMYCPDKHFVCPTDPASRKRLFEIREELFKRLPRVDFMVAHTTDSGGCVCPSCQPYAATYVKLMDEYGRLLCKYHPKAKMGINFYFLTESGKQIALDYLEKAGTSTVGYVYFGLNPAAEPADLQRLPEGLEAYTFYDIAMWPFWGTYGAMPLLSSETLERSLQRDRQIANEPNYAGAVPYSEGLHEDLTRSLYSAWLWDHRASTRNVIREYCRFHFGRDTDDIVELIETIDSTTPIYTHVRTIWGAAGKGMDCSPLVQATHQTCKDLRPVAAKLYESMNAIEKQLPPWAAGGWRWKTLRVRALIDYVFTHFDQLDKATQARIRSEVIALSKQVQEETSYGILRCKRNPDRLGRWYDSLVTKRLKRIYGQDAE